MFKALFGRAFRGGHANADAPAAHAARLYGALVARARDASFFTRFGVPDTFDGRFEALVLHLFLLTHRLKDGSAHARAVSQAVFDLFIDDMDAALREAGVGDQTVPKRIAKMTQVFYGRTGALEAALTAQPPLQAVAEVMARNVRPDEDEITAQDEALAAYVLQAVHMLRCYDEDALFAADQVWPSIEQETAV